MFGDINLLPDNIVHRKSLRFMFIVKVLIFLLFTAMLVSVVLILPYRRWMLESKLVDVNSRISAQGLKDLDDAEKSLAEKTIEVKKFGELIAQLPDISVKFRGVFTGITSHMPSSMTAAGISYESGSRSVILDMISSNREDIALLLKRLNDDPVFTDINISAINGISPEFRFTIILILK